MSPDPDSSGTETRFLLFESIQTGFWFLNDGLMPVIGDFLLKSQSRSKKSVVKRLLTLTLTPKKSNYMCLTEFRLQNDFRLWLFSKNNDSDSDFWPRKKVTVAEHWLMRFNVETRFTGKTCADIDECMNETADRRFYCNCFNRYASTKLLAQPALILTNSIEALLKAALAKVLSHALARLTMHLLECIPI